MQWIEPSEWRRKQEGALGPGSPGDRLKASGGVFAGLILLRVLTGLNPRMSPAPWPIILLIAVAAALFVGCLLPLILNRAPSSIVILSKEGVNNNRLLGTTWKIRHWPWDEIDSWKIVDHPDGTTSLRLVRGTSILVELGIAQRTSRQEVAAYLTKYKP